MRTMLVAGFLGVIGGVLVTPGCKDDASQTVTPSATRVSAWYSGGTLHNANVARWRIGDDHNRLATSLDFLSNRLLRLGVNPGQLDKEALRPLAESLRDCLGRAVDSAADDNDHVPDMAEVCLNDMDLQTALGSLSAP